MQTEQDLLLYVCAFFERLHVPYFITGSVAAIAYGEFRLTNDIDIVAELKVFNLSELKKAFALPEFYLSDEAVKDAIQTRFQFNIIHNPTGYKVDVIIPSPTEFSAGSYHRAKQLPITDSAIARFASPEDVIINKLLFYQEGQSDKHLRDIAGILRVSGLQLDHAYLMIWLSHFGLSPIWNAILEKEKSAE